MPKQNRTPLSPVRHDLVDSLEMESPSHLSSAADPGYAALMVLSIVAGLGLNLYLTRRGIGGMNHGAVRLPAWKRLAIALGALVGASLGAKLPFFFLGSGGGEVETLKWSLFPPGKTIMLGLVGGYAGVEVVKWLVGVRVKTGDGFAVPVAVAVGIGRLACFQGGCCFGTPTDFPWGCQFDSAGDGLTRHPTQLYEAAFHFTAAALLFLCLKRSWFRGQLIKLYFLAYFSFRFLTEFIRPEPELAWGLTFYQWAAFVASPVMGFLWYWDRQKGFDRGITDSVAGAGS